MNGKRVRLFLETAALAVVIGFSPVAGLAQESGSGADDSPFIRHFDQDGDGLVSAQEFPGEADRFSRLDIDGDGTIDEAEAPKCPPRNGHHVKVMAYEFDADGDGELSLDEFPGPLDHFDRMDSDEDGFLSIEELQDGMPGVPRGGGFAGDDADGDGMVSQAEFSGPAELFDRLDANGDGYVTRDEVRRMHPGVGTEETDETEAEPHN